MSLYLQRNSDLVKNKKVIELGAGVGIPSLTALKIGAEVTVTDYPDAELLEMLHLNFNSYENAIVKGLLWGNALNDEKYDVILMADLVFNHSEQEKLLKTVKLSIASNGVALVFFTSHRPWLREKDLLFFKKAQEAGFLVEQLFIVNNLTPVFPEDAKKDRDENDLKIRSSVDAYQLRLA